MATKFVAAVQSMMHLYHMAALDPTDVSVRRDIETLERNIRHTFGDEAEAVLAMARERAHEEPIAAL